MNRNEVLEVQVLKNRNSINIDATGTDLSWTIILKNVINVANVNGAEFKIEGNDTKIIVKSGNCKVICNLA